MKFKQHPSIESYLNTKKIIAQTHKFLKEKKKSFRNFCESLNRNKNAGWVWEKVRQFSNSKDSCRTIKQPYDKQVLQILEALSSHNIDPEFTLHPLNNIKPFSLNEMNNALVEKKDKAPGINDISYAMIRNLPTNLIQSLLKIYNQGLTGELTIPSQ